MAHGCAKTLIWSHATSKGPTVQRCVESQKQWNCRPFKAQHHIYTKKRVEEFWDKYKIAVDDHVVDVDDLLHQALHSGQSKAALNNRAGWWDHKLMDKINTAESLLDPGQMLSREDILKIGGEMLEDFRLGHLTPHRYLRRKRRGGKK